MDTIKRAYHGSVDFCNRVIQWRSAFTPFYVFVVNTAFWAIVYYATPGTQMRILAALASLIFFNDVLLSSTHERSIIVQIMLWPIRDLWRTSAVFLCGAGIHQLGNDNKDEALWCSFIAVLFLLISPIYKYNKVNSKIAEVFRSSASFIKNVLTYCIVRPILYVYEGLKYIFLLRWLPGLANWLRSAKDSLYNGLDRVILQYIRAFGSKCADIFRYWFYFRWVADLKSFLYAHVGEPVLQKLRIVRNYFVYVFGGYWFYPLLRGFGRMTWSLSCYLMSVGNQFAVAVGNSVVWPLIVIMYEKMREVGVVLYDSFGRPVVNVLVQKYKTVEDSAFIYVIGPTVKVMLDSVPEKNPFCNEDDSELDEFMPGPVGDANLVEEEDKVDSVQTEEDDDLLELHDDELDDLNDERFLVKRLQRDFSGTDSSDDEFMLFPKKSTQRKKS